MKILGCFKIVPDLDLIADEDWIADESLNVDTSYGKLLWNCFDEGALEMMLRLSDLSEGFDVVYELDALTVGSRQHERFLKTLYALGFAQCIRVETEQNISFCPEKIAEIVADYVAQQNIVDVIVMGTQSSDGSNMKTPLLLAEKLNWPCITQVTEILPVDETCIKVISSEDGNKATQVIKSPCVLAVGNAPCAYLRVPTLKEKMRLGKKTVISVSSERTERLTDQSTVELTALNSLENKRSTVVITDGTPQEKARELYDRYLRERLKNL
jgi:electron transfer flavoprotein beta subunit